MKHNMSYLCLSTMLILLIMSPISVKSTQIVKKVVQIEPVALDILLPIYERVVVLFTHGINDQNTKTYENSIQTILHKYDEHTLNKTLFAVCDIDKDLSGKLKKFGSKPSLQMITTITHYQLDLPQDLNKLEQFINVEFPNFMDKYTSSKSDTIDLSTIKQNELYGKGYTIIVSLTNTQLIQKAYKIHNRIFDYLQFFNTKLAVNKDTTGKTKIQIYQNGQLYSTYAQSAVQALFNFTSQPVKAEINDLVDYINIETIEDVTELNDQNYFRVFGSSIQYQMLFVYRRRDTQNQQINKIKQQYKVAALRNRKQGLKYQRVLFAIGTTQFLEDYFADQLLQNQNQLYKIVITKTDYSSFQLRKFVYAHPQVTSQKLIQFIEEVKLKKIDANYKSEEVPKDNEDRKIRKIVGNNFEKQIFEQQNKSVMVLFIDSKDTNSSNKILSAVQSFVQKYHDAYKENMNVGIFDLAKNQHKLLTIQTAPQLILFERTNKKKPKFFKGVPSKQSIKNFINFQVKDITIPQNFGQPPIALGGSPKNQQL